MECLKFYERSDKTDVINSRLIQVYQGGDSQKNVMNLPKKFCELPPSVLQPFFVRGTLTW